MPVFPCQNCGEPVGLTKSKPVILCRLCRVQARGTSGKTEGGKNSVIQSFTCQFCTKTFYRYPGNTGANQTFCNLACCKAYASALAIPKKKCWCGEQVSCKGLCRKHYNQQLRPPTGKGSKTGYAKMLFAFDGPMPKKQQEQKQVDDNSSGVQGVGLPRLSGIPDRDGRINVETEDEEETVKTTEVLDEEERLLDNEVQ